MAGRRNRRNRTRRNARVAHWQIVGRPPPGDYVELWAEGFKSKKGGAFDMRNARRAGWVDLRFRPVYMTPDEEMIMAYEEEEYGRAERSHRGNRKRKRKNRGIIGSTVLPVDNWTRRESQRRNSRGNIDYRKRARKSWASYHAAKKQYGITGTVDGDEHPEILAHAYRARGYAKLAKGDQRGGKLLLDAASKLTVKGAYIKRKNPKRKNRGIGGSTVLPVDTWGARESSRRRSAVGRTRRNASISKGTQVSYTPIPGVIGEVVKAHKGGTYDVRWEKSGQVQKGLAGSRLKKT